MQNKFFRLGSWRSGNSCAIFQPMILSVGLDIIELERIERARGRYGEKFAARFLTKNEQISLARRADKLAFLSGRFAAKEAALKALGALFNSGVYLRDIEIVNDKHGKPQVRFPQRLEEKLAGYRLHLSITHSHKTAAAVAILEKNSV